MVEECSLLMEGKKEKKAIFDIQVSLGKTKAKERDEFWGKEIVSA